MKSHLKLPKFMGNYLYELISNGLPEINFRLFKEFYSKNLNYSCPRTKLFMLITKDKNKVLPEEMKPILMQLL